MQQKRYQNLIVFLLIVILIMSRVIIYRHREERMKLGLVGTFVFEVHELAYGDDGTPYMTLDVGRLNGPLFRKTYAVHLTEGNDVLHEIYDVKDIYGGTLEIKTDLAEIKKRGLISGVLLPESVIHWDWILIHDDLDPYVSVIGIQTK